MLAVGLVALLLAALAHGVPPAFGVPYFVGASAYAAMLARRGRG
jgi:hypothetical protein